MNKKRDGTKELKVRNEKSKQIDDDLPQIAKAYYKFINKKK
ncbi:hypothetical protein JCM19274_2201 [Algibacter lectus]|uniref:Uncharacterized protein n=1 Tax=Algibacter lectus TaxID=221126 RepID=A0A090X6C2_9FLAO|nr:hypothetical protein [Algibacter lectus]GAL81027.1 hypothetical protein JCM19274_2201 [Algibacter lectus]